MLTETLSGKCPCCNYDKLLQRYGSDGYLQLDGCANCGFGYSSNGVEEGFGLSAWISYGKHVLSMVNDKIDLENLKEEEIRKLIFDWSESSERFNDIDGTIFKYTEQEIKDHKKVGLEVFKEIKQKIC